MPAELQELDDAMRELLAMLGDPESAGIEGAWARCQEAQAALLALLAEEREYSPEERLKIRKGLEDLVRLNAITRQATRGAQDSLAKSLVKTKRTSETMQGYGKAQAMPGGSCNMAG
jgi:hypothetical protein